MDKSKKIISILAATTLAFSACALSACGGKSGYQGEALTEGYVSDADVVGNGGFLVEKGDYVYFINGSEESTADNTYGDVVKGSLMRVSKTDIAAGDYTKAQILVPSLLSSGDYEAGLYIFGDYVYYATPTNAKNNDGEIENSNLDFKRCRLQGDKAPEQLFRTASNSTKYRFVEVEGKVYCLFEEDSKLKSYDVAAGKTTVLVSGASSFIYNKEKLDDPNVYYTMGVTYSAEQENPVSASYNQIYRVNAAAYAVTDKASASYTVYEGDTKIASYDFDENAMKNAEDKDYDLGDYTTYPYVNLGKLVLDGVGKTAPYSMDTRFNADVSLDPDDKSFFTEPTTLNGYTYTLKQQGNGGLYFTRTNLDLSSDDKAAYLYYLNGETLGDTVTKNDHLETVAKESTNASTSALYSRSAEGVHSYFYVSGTKLVKATAANDGTPSEIELTRSLPSGATLWKEDGTYLYYTTSGTNGKGVGRIRSDGEAANYENFNKDKKQYAPFEIKLIDFYDSWYKPEFVSVGEGEDEKQYLFFANAQSYGTAGAFYYVYATELGDYDALTARNEAIEAVEDYIDEYSENTYIQDVMRYYYRTGETTAYDAVIDLYNSDQQSYFEDFLKQFAGDTPAFALESKYLAKVSRMTDEDVEAIDEGWVNSLKTEEEEETTEESGMPTWAIVLIVCGGVLVVAAGVTVPLLLLRKKKKEARRKEAIVNAYKHKKIDTTDDRSIDVYADENEAETPETDAEEPAQSEEELPAEAEEEPATQTENSANEE